MRIKTLVVIGMLASAGWVAGPVAAQTGGQVVAVADLGGGEGAGAPGSPFALVTFYDLGAGGTRLVVTVEGLRQGQAAHIEIHDGNCTGPALYTLPAIPADAAGRGLGSSTIPAAVDMEHWVLDLHEVPGVCSTVNPALAGPAPGLPGMPATGSPSDSLWWGALAGLGALVLGAGLRRGRRSRRA
jgi:hypothetical protein